VEPDFIPNNSLWEAVLKSYISAEDCWWSLFFYLVCIYQHLWHAIRRDIEIAKLSLIAVTLPLTLIMVYSF